MMTLYSDKPKRPQVRDSGYYFVNRRSTWQEENHERVWKQEDEYTEMEED
jgi:hypothetical protein